MDLGWRDVPDPVRSATNGPHTLRFIVSPETVRNPGVSTSSNWVLHRWMNPLGDTSDEGYTHAVIGAVHEVLIQSEDAGDLTRALLHEMRECQSAGFVVNLSEIPTLTSDHLAALALGVASPVEGPGAGSRFNSWAVRIHDDVTDDVVEVLYDLGVPDVISECSEHRAGRAHGLTEERPG